MRIFRFFSFYSSTGQWPYVVPCTIFYTLILLEKLQRSRLTGNGERNCIIILVYIWGGLVMRLCLLLHIDVRLCVYLQCSLFVIICSTRCANFPRPLIHTSG